MNGEMRWKSPPPPTRRQDPVPQNVHLDAFYGTGSENASALTEETGLAGFRDDCSLYAEAIEEHLAVATNAGNENSSAGELGGDNSAEASGGSDVTYKN